MSNVLKVEDITYDSSFLKVWQWLIYGTLIFLTLTLILGILSVHSVSWTTQVLCWLAYNFNIHRIFRFSPDCCHLCQKCKPNKNVRHHHMTESVEDRIGPDYGTSYIPNVHKTVNILTTVRIGCQHCHSESTSTMYLDTFCKEISKSTL